MMERFGKYTVRTIGLGLVVIGILLFIIGPFGGPYQSCPPVPSTYPGGCPLPPGTLFISGIALIIPGIILLVFAGRMKADPRVNPVDESSERVLRQKGWRESLRGGFLVPF